MDNANTKPNITIEAVIIRADGTVENLGVIAETKPKGRYISLAEYMERLKSKIRGKR